MVGNLQIFLGPEVLNEYGAWLQHAEWIWPARLVMLGAIVAHIWSAVALIQISRAARPQRYQKTRQTTFTTMAARSMRWGGVVVLLFLLFHLADLTFGVQGASAAGFEHGEVYSNLTSSLARPPVAGLYIVANLALAMHLYHGVWSMIHTVGVTNVTIQSLRRPLAGFFAVVIPGGNICIALACVTGTITSITGH
jgi:succinate dehydrogenase / fumarate reductase cytochrome b subunit